VFTVPDQFYADRALHPHLTFATGAHACLGMGLARLELQVALLALFQRFPNLRFDPSSHATRRTETRFCRGFAELPVLTH
jgi:cytochrome P450